MEDKKVLRLLKEGQDEYEKIVGKEIHYVYVNNKRYEELIIKPNKSNFMHLCGITYVDSENKRRYKPKQFYDFLQKGTVKMDWIVKDKKHTEQKLQVLHHLKDLLDPRIQVINKLVTLVNMEFIRGFRVNRKLFCLGLVLGENRDLEEYVPLTLLNLKTDPKASNLPTGCPVHCIYWVEADTKKINIICKTSEFDQYESLRPYPYLN